MPRVSLERRRTAPYPALTIAKWFIAWAEAEREELSNLKLQKLLYYAQGHHLAEQHRLLFPDEIQAWSHGPVVPEVYHAVQGMRERYHRAARRMTRLPGMTSILRPPRCSASVWNTYGGFSAGRLRNMTHEEPPWRAHFRLDERNTRHPSRRD